MSELAYAARPVALRRRGGEDVWEDEPTRLAVTPPPRNRRRDVHWRSEWPTDLPAVLEAQRLMSSLGTDAFGTSGLSGVTRARVLQFLRDVSNDRTTFPSIVPDDDGTAVLHWAAGSDAVQVDVDETGPIYLWIRHAGATFAIDGDARRIRAEASRALDRIARDVDSINPDWRRSYRQR